MDVAELDEHVEVGEGQAILGLVGDVRQLERLGLYGEQFALKGEGLLLGAKGRSKGEATGRRCSASELVSHCNLSR